MVLDESQRIKKRQLIEDNRERRKIETIRAKLKEGDLNESITENDEANLMQTITNAYCTTFEV